MILPNESKAIWDLKVLHAYLVGQIQKELNIGLQWSIFDMRGNYIEMSQFMKKNMADQCQLWLAFENCMADQW